MRDAKLAYALSDQHSIDSRDDFFEALNSAK
jgi:hypothetical protein